MKPVLPGAVPDDIIELHRELLRALRVDFFRPGLAELNYWSDFLYVMKPLAESEGGPFTKADIAPVIRKMRDDNQRGVSNWSLRFAKIMRDPESFRDLVLIARKQSRPREPKKDAPVRRSLGEGGTVSYLEERDPAAERNPVAIAEHISEWKRTMRGPQKGRESK